MHFPAALLLHPEDHWLGSPQARLVVVQYGDYQAAVSLALWRILQEETARHAGEISAIYRHFPPLEKGSLQLGAAEAAECAAAQGRFWEMHELLSQPGKTWDEGALVECAARLNLNVTKFLRDMSCRRWQTRVEQDLASGLVLGVTCAPALWVGNQRLTIPEEKCLRGTLHRLLQEIQT